jgi:hypothetical protein
MISEFVFRLFIRLSHNLFISNCCTTNAPIPQNDLSPPPYEAETQTEDHVFETSSDHS